MTTEYENRKNRVFFVQNINYLSINVSNTLIDIIDEKNGFNFKASKKFIIKHFQYFLDDKEVKAACDDIENRTAIFRGRCLEKIHELAIHHSDRSNQLTKIELLVKSMNKVADCCDGRYFI